MKAVKNSTAGTGYKRPRLAEAAQLVTVRAMSLELPLTALALEVAGTAARAVGAGQTLTFPLSVTQADADDLLFAAVGTGQAAMRPTSFAVTQAACPAITVTL